VDVIVAGAHGNIGQRLVRRLAGAGHHARGLVRREEQAGRIEELGGQAVVADLEAELDPAVVDGADAIVFTAGAGPGSGPERKQTLDYGGAVKLIEVAEARGVSRYVMVSAMGAADPEAGPEKMLPYLRAKAGADERLAQSSLAWTIVRPGVLTDEPGQGTVEAAERIGRRGEISRDDVAEALAVCLEESAVVRRTFELLAGPTPVREALRAL
jgi:uncharacterized protein YbjT (DUF2867 family)